MKLAYITTACLLVAGIGGASLAGVKSLPRYMAESGIPTQREIGLCGTWVGKVTGGRASGRGWVDGWLGDGLPFRFTYGGKSSDEVLSGWRRSASEATDASGERREISWTEPQSGLRVVWAIGRFTDYPAVEWVLTFENTGAKDTPIIEDVQALRLRMGRPAKDGGYTVHGAYGGRSLPNDLMPFSKQVTGEVRLGTTGENPEPWFYACHSSHTHLPFFNLESPDRRGVMVGVGWSGQWLARVRSQGTELLAEVGLKETHFALHPGEKVRSPRMLVVLWEGERLHGNNMLRQVLYRHYVPHLDGKPQTPLVTTNVCFTYHGKGGYLYCGENEILPLVKPFAEIGAEALAIDAGWWDCDNNYNLRIGDLHPSVTRYPNGLKPIAEPLKKAGMRLGVWSPVEMIDPALPFAKEHPELIADNRWELGPWRMRLELPEARRHVLNQIDNLVKNEGVDCYRQDFYTVYRDDSPDRRGIMEMEHLAGLYELQDEIVKRHPSMLMEGCCAGGHRLDLEAISRFHWHQKSDRWFDSVSDQCGLYGANLFLPGGTIDVPTEAVDDYGFWSSFGGQICLAWHPLDSDFPIGRARAQVERYKQIRPLLSGDFYPLTGCALDAPWIAYQFHRSDLDKGFALAFRRPNAAQGDGVIKVSLKGLDSDAKYRVHLEHAGKDMTLSGTELAKGLDIRVDDRPGAEMVVYERLID